MTLISENADESVLIDTAVPNSLRSTPTHLDRPAFLMNLPFSLDTAEPNNVWMEDYDSATEREPDHERAMLQFLDLYSFIAAEAVVMLLPTPRVTGLQDLVYTANLGIVLDHLPGPEVAVIANFTSPPRRAETPVGQQFFESMGYRTVVSPHPFEGEAELKHLHDNVYVGGWGQRTDKQAYEWMEREFDMRVVPLKMTDPYLYHLDCSVFPLTRDETIVCTSMFEPEEIRELERHTGIVDVSLDEAYAGIANSVRVGNLLLNATHIHELERDHKDFASERAKNRRLEDIAAERACEVAYFNVSEYHKSGALLSCMVMHLNRRSYDFRLL